MKRSKQRGRHGKPRPGNAPPPAGNPGGDPDPSRPLLNSLSPGRILLTALAFALWTGLAEEIPIQLARWSGIFVRVSPDLVWMAPLADLAFFGLAAFILFALGVVWPGARTRPVVLGTMTGLTVLALGFLQERLYPLAVMLLAAGVASVVARRARPAPRRLRALPVSAAAAMVVILSLTAYSKLNAHAQREGELAALPEAATGAPNVLLLILDTVRGASLGLLSGQREASLWPPAPVPNLDALARNSIVFENALAPAPWTLPSHASMFTGQWPHRLTANWGRPLDDRYPTVAEVMAQHGYLTVGIVGNLLYASRETGLGRGFLYYQDYAISPGQILLSCSMGRFLLANGLLRRLVGFRDVPNRLTAEDVTNRFLDWEGRHGERPYFAFINYFDAHEPYFPSDSVRRVISPGVGWDDYAFYTGLLTGVHGRRKEKWTMTRAEGEVHAMAYAEAIQRVDEAMGRLLAELGARGALDNTVLIVASDHGEQLGEHGLFEHQNSLYRTSLHVPLLIRPPQGPADGRRIPDAVSLRDMGATILDLAGLDILDSGIGGTSLARFWRNPLTGPLADASPSSSPRQDTVFSVLNPRNEGQEWLAEGEGPVMYSMSDSTFHYIRNPDGTEELFTPRRDPGERRSLVGVTGFQSVVETFRGALGDILEAPPKPGRQ